MLGLPVLYSRQESETASIRFVNNQRRITNMKKVILLSMMIGVGLLLGGCADTGTTTTTSTTTTATTSSPGISGSGGGGGGGGFPNRALP